jgi:hypothetical protein
VFCNAYIITKRESYKKKEWLNFKIITTHSCTLLVSEIMNRKVMLMGKVDKLLKKDNDDNA